MTGLEYHNATKHTPESVRRSARALDWANMPDPFRHYEGAPLIDLPADSNDLLTTIAWREAWKYGNRAYRYCLLDAGHAWQSLALSAQALGCETTAVGHFDDDAAVADFRLAPDEWPMLRIRVQGAPQFPASTE